LGPHLIVASVRTGQGGSLTASALHEYQARHGLPVTGELDVSTLSSLSEREVERVIERKKLEAERKRLEETRRKLETAVLPKEAERREIAQDGAYIAYANGVVRDRVPVQQALLEILAGKAAVPCT